MLCVPYSLLFSYMTWHIGIFAETGARFLCTLPLPPGKPGSYHFFWLFLRGLNRRLWVLPRSGGRSHHVEFHRAKLSKPFVNESEKDEGE